MSFLTMMGPSPDWNVGLSAEDLCTKECGWVQKVVQDLIPWDAGTDSGVTYEVGVPPPGGSDEPPEHPLLAQLCRGHRDESAAGRVLCKWTYG